MSYNCVPDWQKPAVQDPFDYKLRSKEEVKEEFKYYYNGFDIQSTYKKYTAGDTRAEDNLDNRDRVAKIWVQLNEMGLAPLQRERFIFLLGNRYTGSDKIKLVCRQYNTFHENYIRVNEILREIYWESKRAPSLNITALKNPYRREFFKKKFLGRTREDRQSFLASLEAEDKEHRLTVDKEELGLLNENASRQESLRKKRRDYAQRRLSLGFNDKGKEEVADSIIEELEQKSKEYEKQIEEQKERKPVKLVTQVKGISKHDIDSLLLQDADKFKPI